MKIDKNNSLKAFTLIELLVVISIIGMLSSVVLATLNGARDKGSIAAGQTFDRHTYVAWYESAVLAWDFNDNTNLVVQDQMGNGNNITITNLSSINNTKNPFKDGYTFNVNTANTWTATMGSSVNNPPPSTGDYSISFWLYKTGGIDDIELISNSYVFTTDGKWKFNLQDEGKLTFTVRLSSAKYVQTSLKLDQWYHVMGVCNGNKIILYVNGKTVTNSNLLGGTCPYRADPIRMTGTPALASSYYIDNVRIYKTAFTVAMAEELYLAEKEKFDNLAMEMR